MNQIFNTNSTTQKNEEVIAIRGVKKAITDFCMLTDNERSVVVGLSGGADSIMLTHLLKHQLKLTVYACHINHMLRGQESERDMQFVVDFCKENEIPLWCNRVDVTDYARKNSLSIEEAGREVRYSVYEQAREHFGAAKIATAHTLSDNAETLLLNLSRGCGLNGLCSIPAVRELIIRPLIYLSRQAIEHYCLDHSLCYVTDSTNLESIYTRNKIRLEVMPKLFEVNPQILSSMAKTITVLNYENDYMQSVADTAYEYAKRADGLSIDRLNEHHIAIRHRMLSRFLDDNQLQKNSDLISKLNYIVQCGKGKINVKSNIFIEVKKHTLIISDNTNILDYYEHELELGEYVDGAGQCYTIKLCDNYEIETLKKIYRKLLYTSCDYDKIIGKIFIRQRKSGDRITLPNRGGSKSIKKLFIDDKLTASAKSQTLLLSDEQGVIAVMGYGEDTRVTPDETTNTYLVVLKHSE